MYSSPVGAVQILRPSGSCRMSHQLSSRSAATASAARSSALAQLDEYLSRLSLAEPGAGGTLIIFDRRPGVIRKQPAPEFSRHRTPGGREITPLTV